jgi:hypothetical protein
VSAVSRWIKPAVGTGGGDKLSAKIETDVKARHDFGVRRRPVTGKGGHPPLLLLDVGDSD